MSEEAAQVQSDNRSDSVEPATQDMDLEAEADPKDATNGKRDRKEYQGGDEEEEEEEVSKKAKLEKSVEEERLEKENPSPLKLSAKEFGSSEEMFNYFFKLLHGWLPNIDFNKYEHMMLLELLSKGHPEPEKKMGSGIKAFQIRFHPLFKSKCFFLVREDGSVEDFSFRKCVDHILPLPEDMQAKPVVANGGGRGGERGRGRGGRGRGRR